MEFTIFIKTLEKNDIIKVLSALNGSLQCESRTEKYIRDCFKQNITGERITFIAYLNNQVAGLVNIIFKSSYSYFMENGIPEINDLLVLTKYRKRGIGKMLIDECEKHVRCEYDYIGLGVGLYKDYGSAQRLYTKNGYILDGKGLIYNNLQVKPGMDIFVDDDLLLYLLKKVN